MTPAERHGSQERAILAKKKSILVEAKRQHSESWSGSIRNWATEGGAWLNSDKADRPEIKVLETVA